MRTEKFNRINTMRTSFNNRGFTLIELLVVIAIIGVLATVVLASLNQARAKARDAQRISDIRQLQNVLLLYYDDTGSFPAVASSGDAGPGGWRVSYLQNFLAPLTPYLPQIPVDPINSGPPSSMFNPRPDGSFYYSYYAYPSGTPYGCDFSGPFAVITIRAFETSGKANLQKAQCGPQGPGCAGGGIPGVCRDWSTEFDYSVIVSS